MIDSAGSIEQSSEMQEILNSIGTLKDSFESMDRPSDLPKQGERLPELQVPWPLRHAQGLAFNKQAFVHRISV